MGVAGICNIISSFSSLLDCFSDGLVCCNCRWRMSLAGFWLGLSLLGTALSVMGMMNLEKHGGKRVLQQRV